MTLLDTTAHLFSPAQAVAVARELQQDDPDWTYQVVHDPKGTGYSYIVVYDENGRILGTY